MKSKLKTYLIASPFVVALFYLFFNYVPWLFGRKPIENIGNYQIKNVPPPDGVVSFAINHGEAIYFYEKTQLELIVASVVFFISIAVLAAITGRKRRNDT